MIKYVYIIGNGGCNKLWVCKILLISLWVLEIDMGGTSDVLALPHRTKPWRLQWCTKWLQWWFEVLFVDGGSTVMQYVYVMVCDGRDIRLSILEELRMNMMLS